MDFSDIVPQSSKSQITKGRLGLSWGVIALFMQELGAKKGVTTSIFLVSSQ